MKTRKIVFTVSCAVLLVILGFSMYKSYFQNPVSKPANVNTVPAFNHATQAYEDMIISENASETADSANATQIENTTKKSASPTPVDGDFSCFDNCVFIGNSRFVSFKNYGLCKNVYAVVGLTVDTIFTKSASANGTTVINSLYGKDYDKVILMLGDNECGWPYQDVVIERYAKVVDAVRDRVPNAEIYIHAVLPISAEAHAKNEYGCNNNVINSLNLKIKEFCANEGIKYIEQPSCLKASDGSLLAEAASDGVHLNKTYSEIWLDYLKNTIL